MGLIKYKLGEFIEISDLRNSDKLLTEDDVVGLSTQKQMIKTKADLDGVNLGSYKVLKPGYFAYVPDTSRRGEKVSMAYNDTENDFIVSSISIVFYVKEPEKLNPIYLFMFFNRPEFDRFARYNSWGSARETFDWKTMCDIEIELPSIEIQKKFAKIYLSLVENQKSYECGLNELKFTCDAFVENGIQKDEYHKLGDYVELNNKRNDNGALNEDDIRGFDVNGDFISPKRTFDGDILGFRVIDYDDFVYNPRIPKVTYPVALNKGPNRYLVSPAYVSFSIKNKTILDPDYLLMILQRTSFSRKVLFNTWGSSTPFLRHVDLCDISIPIPALKMQKNIAAIYKAFNDRRLVNEELKLQIKRICPILIKGSLDEARA